jgi:hypothetical protein
MTITDPKTLSKEELDAALIEARKNAPAREAKKRKARVRKGSEPTATQSDLMELLGQFKKE